VPTPWHALTPAEVCRRLDTTPTGLDDSEAAARLVRIGPNELRPPAPASAWGILAEQFRNVVTLLLVAAGAVALLSGHALDAAAIVVVLLLNAALGFLTDLPARRALEALTRLQVARATVVRGGRPQDIEARRLVPGDVIALEAGQAVPADARLLAATELQTVEAPLTGESLPVDKVATAELSVDTPLPDHRTMVYQGTTIVAGRAQAVIVATGTATEVGRIGSLASALPERATPLQLRLDALGRRLALAAVLVAAVVALLGWLQGVPVTVVLASAIALAVAAVPEGLPAVVTVTMAVGVRRMARRRALIRRLPVVESLGSATVICTDKTGTLTTGAMTATALSLGGGRELAITGVGYSRRGLFLDNGVAVDPQADPQLAAALRIAALANRGGLMERDGATQPQGDPTEVALLVAAGKAGVDRSTLLASAPEIAELPFSSDRMYMATFHVEGSGVRVYLKGAPERVLDLCDRVLTPTGEQPAGSAARAALHRQRETLAARGLRVLAVASGPVARPTEDAIRDLVFVGVFGLTDPPTPGVEETIRAIRAAGIRPVMLTGDHRSTAEAVARALGVLSGADETLDGRELAALPPATLAERVARVGAFSRIGPEDKLKLVAAYQARGEVVAMLGDGVNDAPALRQADIGVAMGLRGSDVAREAADLVLQDDRLETVAAAIEEGRVIFDNIRKFVFYLFSCNLAEVLVFLGAAVAGWPLPLQPLQILWLNLVTDTFPALALALEPAEPDVMRRPPRAPRTAILSGSILRATVTYAVLIAASALAAFSWGLVRWPDDPAQAITAAFVTLGLAQTFHLGNARSTGPVVTTRRALSNRHALAAVALALALLWLAVSWGPLAQTLGTHPLTAPEWAVVVGLGLAPGVLGQAIKSARAGWTKARPRPAG
jgi:Ca2+-transporting ATPase